MTCERTNKQGSTEKKTNKINRWCRIKTICRWKKKSNFRKFVQHLGMFDTYFWSVELKLGTQVRSMMIDMNKNHLYICKQVSILWWFVDEKSRICCCFAFSQMLQYLNDQCFICFDVWSRCKLRTILYPYQYYIYFFISDILYKRKHLYIYIYMDVWCLMGLNKTNEWQRMKIWNVTKTKYHEINRYFDIYRCISKII